MAFALAQQREMIAAQKDTTAAGVAYAQALGLVQAAEKVAYDTAIRKAAEDKKAAEQEAARASIVSSNVRMLEAQGESWAAEQLRMSEGQKTEMDALIKSMGATVDPLAVAALSAAQAAEKARAAWQHTQDVINQGSSWITQQAGVFGTSPADAFKQETQNFGFDGKTLDQVKALYTTWTQGAQLTPAQQAVNDHIAPWVADYIKIHPTILAAAQPAAGSLAAAAAGATSAYASVTSTVTERSSLQLIDLTRAQVSTLNKIELNTRSGGGGGGAPVFNITMRFGTDDAEFRRAGQELLDEVKQELDAYLGTKSLSAKLYSGSVSH